jgi:hypothetical protein
LQTLSKKGAYRPDMLKIRLPLQDVHAIVARRRICSGQEQDIAARATA